MTSDFKINELRDKVCNIVKVNVPEFGEAQHPGDRQGSARNP